MKGKKKIEVILTILQFLLPEESFQAAEHEGENLTEVGGLPGLRKPIEYSGRTKQLEFTGRRLEKRELHSKGALEICTGFSLCVQQHADQSIVCEELPNAEEKTVL